MLQVPESGSLGLKDAVTMNLSWPLRLLFFSFYFYSAQRTVQGDRSVI
jgi:hypothetical protein